MGTHYAHEIAAEIRVRVPGVPVKKLHKLLYYCQGHHLGTFGETLFEERISAWNMGPVVGQLWWAEQQGRPVAAPVTSALTEAELNTIGYVVSRYGKLSGLDLEHLTHGERPWIDADQARQAQGVKSIEISPASLAEFFRAGDRDGENADEPAPDPQVVHEWLKEVSNQPPGAGVEDTPESLMARL
jgi:uncharacterized phage-associated protein